MPSNPPPPSPAAQIRFLQQLQRLLDEGSFTATYKYALLHAIADLCVTRGDDSGGPLTLGTDDIAERYIELYWRQAMPFPAPSRSEDDAEAILAQNTGPQAAIVRQVREARARYGGSLARMQSREGEWDALRSEVEYTIRRYPLKKLQNVAGERLEFLYSVEGGREVTLRPGVAFCCRAFYPMIADMVEGAWAQYIRRHNQALLDDAVELRSFLFGSDRGSLARFGPMLRDLQEGACFYCDAALPADFQVDHFIPWRRYPVDLGHNFVLAHGRCNARKGDRLAAETHLARWSERNEAYADELKDRFLEADVPADLDASRSVARWAYSEVERIGGTVWVTGSEVRKLTEGWREVMG